MKVYEEEYIEENLEEKTEGKQNNKESLSLKRKGEILFKEIDNPLCSISNIIYINKPELGWMDYTNEMKRLCADKWSTQWRNVFDWFKNNFQLKNADPNEFSIYYEWIFESGKEFTQGNWVPYKLTQEEMLFANGILNLRTLDFNAFITDIGLHKRIIFGPSSDIKFDDNFKNFILELKNSGFSVLNSDVKELLGNAFKSRNTDYIWNLFERISCILQPHKHAKREFYFYGASNTFKTTLAKAIIYAIAGKKGCSEATQEELVRDKWGLVAILYKFVNLSDDSPFCRKWMSAMKNMTGSGSFRLERKNENPTEVSLTCKFLNCVNELPYSEEGIEIKERIEIFEFTNKHDRSNKIDQEQYITGEYWQEKERRKSMLALLICAAHRLLNRGEYLQIEEYTEKRQELLDQIDPIEDTLRNYIVEGGDDDFVSTYSIMAIAFREEGNRQLEMKVRSYIEKMYPDAIKIRKQFNGNKIRGYTGLKLLKKFHNQEE